MDNSNLILSTSIIIANYTCTTDYTTWKNYVKDLFIKENLFSSEGVKKIYFPEKNIPVDVIRFIFADFSFENYNVVLVCKCWLEYFVEKYLEFCPLSALSVKEIVKSLNYRSKYMNTDLFKEPNIVDSLFSNEKDKILKAMNEMLQTPENNLSRTVIWTPFFNLYFKRLRQIGPILLKEQFMSCVRSGYMGCCRFFIKCGVDLLSDPYVAEAVHSEHITIAEMLLEARADVDAYRLHMKTALCFAAESGNISAINLLLHARADPQGKNDNYPLISAISSRNIDAIRYFLQSDPDILTKGLTHASTNVTWLSIDSLADVVELLINAGANANSLVLESEVIRGSPKIVALCLTVPRTAEELTNVLPFVNSNFTQIAGALIKAGASVQPEALLKAFVKRSLVIAKICIEKGISPHVKTHDGEHLLHFAVKQSKWNNEGSGLGLISLLLDSNVDIETPNKEGSTSLHIAAYHDCFDAVKLLLESRANPNLKNNAGWAPIHMASTNGRSEIIKLLLEHGANQHEKDNEGQTPLHSAIIHGKTNNVTLLLAANCNPNEKDKEGQSPMHLAANYGYGSIVDCLQAAGANVNAVDELGQTPLHLCALGSNDQLLQMLIQYGGDKNARDKFGYTPLTVKNAIKILD